MKRYMQLIIGINNSFEHQAKTIIELINNDISDSESKAV